MVKKEVKKEYKPRKTLYGKRVYIGNLDGEEFYLRPIKWDCGWYFGGVYLEGLRPETEDALRERARDTQLSDYYDVKNIPSQYLDEEQFQEDMEDDWYENADIQAEQERDGETYYLCFGTHTHADSVLLNDCKGLYKQAKEKFDKLIFTEEQFKKLVAILKKFYALKTENSGTSKYLKAIAEQESVLEEYEQFIGQFAEFPTEDFWVGV